MVLTCGGSDAQVLGSVELGLRVLGGVEERFPPVVVRVFRAVQCVSAVELVPDGAVLVPRSVTFGLVPRQLAVLGLPFGVDDLL